jgi:predicted nucleic acid-binding protein
MRDFKGGASSPSGLPGPGEKRSGNKGAECRPTRYTRVSHGPITVQHVSRAVDLSRQFGLLTGDALIVAVMQAQGLSALASLDADFERVPGIIRYAPV